jgi:hypothetical protein
MSSKTQLIIQAIKELGRERIGNDEVRKIRSKLSDEEKEIVMKESQQTTACAGI